MKKVVFWDFDGTLVYCHHLWSNSVFDALKSVEPDTDVSFQEIRKHMAYGYTWHTPEKDFTAYKGEKWWELMNAHIYKTYLLLGLDEKKAKQATEKVRGLIKIKEKYFLFDDTVETLKALQGQGVKNVILSNNYPELEETVTALELKDYFDGIIVSALEGYDKPRKELFEIAKKRFPADKYFMVGDNPVADIKGGNDAGMTTILVHNGFDSSADYCFDCLKDIINLTK